MKSIHARTGVVALLAALAACDSPTRSAGPAEEAGPPAAVVRLGATSLSGTVSTPLADSIAVRVTDARGNPVAGAAVVWVAPDGSGVFHPNPGVTSADGIARARWWLGKVAGPQQVEATVSSGAGGMLSSGLFQAVAQPGPPHVLARVQATVSLTGLAGAPLADSVGVYLYDEGGNLLPGVPVEWTVTGGGGSVSPATSQSSAAGIARTRWTLGPAGAQGLRASVGALTLAIDALATTTPPGFPRIRDDGAAFSRAESGTDYVGTAATVWNDGPEVTMWMEYATNPTLQNPSYTAQAKYRGTETETSRYFAGFQHPTADQTPHYYRFAASNSVGITRTPITKYTPPPPLPPPTDIPGLRARQGSNMAVVFEWDDSVDAWYFVQRQTAGGGWLNVADRGGGIPPVWFANNAFDVTFNVRENTAGPWRVQRCQRLQRGDVCTDWIPVAAIPIVPLAAPSNLRAVRNGTSVTLTWDDNTPHEWRYMVLRDGVSLTRGTAPAGLPDPWLPANTTTFTDHATVAGFTHRYTVVAWGSVLYTDGNNPRFAADRQSLPSNAVDVPMPPS